MKHSPETDSKWSLCSVTSAFLIHLIDFTPRTSIFGGVGFSLIKYPPLQFASLFEAFDGEK
jgi:hypothetical protein